MNADVIVAIVVLAAAVIGMLLLILWILRISATFVIGFTAFMFELPLIVSVPAFIIFPPAFFVFLGGLFLLWAGQVDDDGMWHFGSPSSGQVKNGAPKKANGEPKKAEDDHQMTVEHEGIQITGVDTDISGGVDGSSAFDDVVLILSKSAPSDWAHYFDALWAKHSYMKKRRASVSGNHLTIRCVPDELEKDHLPELKKIVNETNQRYKEHLVQKEQDTQRERERTEAQKAELDKLKNIKLD